MVIRFTGILPALAITLLFACKKGSDAPLAYATAGLDVINASADTVNFYMNGTRLNSGSSLYPLGASGYFQVKAGAQNYELKKIFRPAGSMVQQLFALRLDLPAASYSSLFVCGPTAADAFGVRDTLLTDTTSGTCLVRFVNAAPAAGKLDFSAGSLRYAGQGFGAASGFRLADTGRLVPVSLYSSGTATPLLSGHYPLAAGKSYTFYATGNSGTGSKGISLGATINVD